MSESHAFDTLMGAAVLGSERLFRVPLGGSRVLWIPAQALDLNSRLITVAHMRGVGHGAVAVTSMRLQLVRSWTTLMVR